MRVDASDRTVTPLTPSLGPGARIDTFFASADETRFVATVIADGDPNTTVPMLGDARGWKRLQSVSFWNDAGGLLGAEVVDFDANVLRSMSTVDAVAASEGRFVVSEHAGTHGLTTWTAYDANGAVGPVFPGERDESAPAVLLDDWLVVSGNGTCSAFAVPSLTSTTFGCDSNLWPWRVRRRQREFRREDVRLGLALRPARGRHPERLRPALLISRARRSTSRDRRRRRRTCRR